jgi:hypothetical protein
MYPTLSSALLVGLPAALALWAMAVLARQALRDRAERVGTGPAHARLATLLEAYWRAWGLRRGLILRTFVRTEENAFGVALARMEVVSYCLHKTPAEVQHLFPSVFGPLAPGETVPMPALDVWMGYQGRRPRVLVAQPDSVLGRLPEEGFAVHEQAIGLLTEATLPRFWGRPCPVPPHAHLATWEHGTASLHAQMEALAALQRLLPKGVALQDLPMDAPLSNG